MDSDSDSWPAECQRARKCCTMDKCILASRMQIRDRTGFTNAWHSFAAMQGIQNLFAFFLNLSSIWISTTLENLKAHYHLGYFFSCLAIFAWFWFILADGFYSHHTIHHYRISILNRSNFLQLWTNLSETLHVGEIWWPESFLRLVEEKYGIRNWCIHHSQPSWCK